jgi:hypothetical protein
VISKLTIKKQLSSGIGTRTNIGQWNRIGRPKNKPIRLYATAIRKINPISVRLILGDSARERIDFH